MARKYCPNCKTILSPIILLSNFDVPNDYRTSSYFCKKCSEKHTIPVIVCFSYTKLTEFKQKGKFPSSVKYVEKLVNYLKSKDQCFLHETKNNTKFCPECKNRLHYDANASNLSNDSIKVRTWFHLDCKINNQNRTIFFFTSQKIENIIINRIIIG